MGGGAGLESRTPQSKSFLCLVDDTGLVTCALPYLPPRENGGGKDKDVSSYRSAQVPWPPMGGQGEETDCQIQAGKFLEIQGWDLGRIGYSPIAFTL